MSVEVKDEPVKAWPIESVVPLKPCSGSNEEEEEPFGFVSSRRSYSYSDQCLNGTLLFLFSSLVWFNSVTSDENSLSLSLSLPLPLPLLLFY